MLTVRFTVFSDLHLFCWQHGSTIVNGRNSRLLDQQDVLRQFTEYCDRNSIDHVLFAGDFFHQSKVSAEVLMAAHESLSPLKAGRRLFFLLGNHDCQSKDNSIHALSMLSNYGTVIDSWYDSKHIAALPYTEDKDKLTDFLSQSLEDKIILLHQGVANIPINSKGFTLNEILTPDMVPDNAAFCFTGHYHSHKKVKDNLYIPGSPMQLTWGDKNEKRGWLDVNLETREVKHIESKAPKFIEFSLGDNRTGYEGNFVRLLSTDNVAMEEIRKQYESARSIEVVYDKPEIRYERIERFDTFTGLFEEFVREKELSEEYVLVGRKIIS